ncbi:hypothetical protein AAVH_41414 [Aphelenchoides avenae]|nr:hypothetical protein AAVH_41414 [Aphelenchus avenae]
MEEPGVRKVVEATTRIPSSDRANWDMTKEEIVDTNGHKHVGLHNIRLKCPKNGTFIALP